jgi:hypothetical protein
MSYQQILQNLNKTLNKALEGNISDNEDYAKFYGLPFYHWDKLIDQQQGTFVELVGFPRKRNRDLPMFDYEHQIFQYLERDEPTDSKNKHLAIIKSSGLGITTLLLYYIGWKCTKDNAWSGKRVHILTAPRIELTIDLVTRLKNIFTRNNLLQFNDNNTTCTINNCIIQAFPSHLGLRSMRGYTGISAIIVDEASWFNLNQNQEITDTIERFKAKEDPLIVACSTPQTIGDWLYNIKQQPEQDRFYHLMELSYKVGLGKIYTEQEIELQKKSLSFAREYNLSFESGIDALFNVQDLEAVFSDKYDTSEKACTIPSITRWLGVDFGAASSATGLCILQFRDQKMEVVYEAELKYADGDSLRSLIHSLISKYHICRCFVDGSSVFMIRQLCKDYGIPDVTLYDDKTRDALLLSGNCGGGQLIHSVTFLTKHRQMLEQLHKIISTHQLRVDPVKFPRVATALRTATNKPNGNIWDLDKTQSSSNDVLDALRLSLLCLRSNN